MVVKLWASSLLVTLLSQQKAMHAGARCACAPELLDVLCKISEKMALLVS